MSRYVTSLELGSLARHENEFSRGLARKYKKCHGDVDKNMGNVVEKRQSATARIEPWWTFIGAPVTQEFIFRLLPYQLYLITGSFYGIGVVSSFLFAAIHWYFGKWFVLYSLVWGLILWWMMTSYGFAVVVIIHAVLNIIHWQLGILPRKLKSPSG